MCVFCNQRSISGKRYFDIQDVRAEIERALSTLHGGCEAEIAYFGGSFTGIDRHTMICLLDIAQKFVDKPGNSEQAHVRGIRMSTRPDYIDKEIMEQLVKLLVHLKIILLLIHLPPPARQPQTVVRSRCMPARI